MMPLHLGEKSAKPVTTVRDYVGICKGETGTYSSRVCG